MVNTSINTSVGLVRNGDTQNSFVSIAIPMKGSHQLKVAKEPSHCDNWILHCNTTTTVSAQQAKQQDIRRQPILSASRLQLLNLHHSRNEVVLEVPHSGI